MRVLQFVLLSVCCVCWLGCKKNYTRYFPDPNSNGQAIFSNTANNLMTCFIQGKPWRSTDRSSGGLITPVNRSELSLYYMDIAGGSDTLRISWEGYYLEDVAASANSVVVLKLPVPDGFSKANFSQFKGKRLSLNGTNGYGVVSAPGIEQPFCNANIYFHEAVLHTRANGTDSGYISGLFELSAPAFVLSSGRFDHFLGQYEVQW
jgi:hypothetical protein